LQVFAAAVHEPATHACPWLQSAAAWHGHGPALPPHASQTPATQVPPAQSALVVQSFLGPGSMAGAAQSPLLQTSPFAHGTPSEHVCVQPLAVHTEPGAQLAAPVQAECAGGATLEQPYASQSKQPVLSQ
jgi:hypothetical protein